MFVQRSSAHVSRSSSDVFRRVRDDLFSYLVANHVAVAEDSFGGNTSAEQDVPLETVRRIAKDNDATWLLHVTVDRPVMDWVRVTLTCYDSSGRQLWEDSAANGASLSGGGGLKATLKKLHKALAVRLGQPGLPLLAGDRP
jgi:hypothetical protein